MNSNKLGAMPPPEFSWMMGKTVHTIQFVKEAETWYETHEDFEQLGFYINTLKNVRKEQVPLEVTFSSWLQENQNQHNS